jgi:hypothetical protein
VYALHMLKERLQILVTAEQRRLLEAEARRRQTSVAALIRDAIDGRYGTVTREDRMRAVEELGRMNARYVPPDELGRMIDEEREETAGELRLDPPR